VKPAAKKWNKNILDPSWDVLKSAHCYGMMLTCIATGKSSWKSGGKKRSACFLEKPGFPITKQSIRTTVIRAQMSFK
jgi:hypothetical protein